MLGLKLRPEFSGKRIKGTVVDFSNKDKTGALDRDSSDFLKITYPSLDILKALEYCQPENAHPIVLQGARGQGKSHLMAVLFHAFKDQEATKRWLSYWADKMDKPKIKDFVPKTEYKIIAESLHKQRYKFLWELVFDQHPRGEFYKGKWNNSTNVPGYDLLLEMFEETPTVLLLDEFQTWFEGLTDTKKEPFRSWAFNFIQILSEIAKERPDKLVLVVSVRDGSSDAYQQLHRVAPVMITFTESSSDVDLGEGVESGTLAIKRRDRQNMILHRLFENRDQVSKDNILNFVDSHTSEFFRLKNIPESDFPKWKNEFIDCWPFSPILIKLLEDQVLISTEAQETRDLIRILASLYKAYEDEKRVITPSCFRIDNDKSGVAVLIDSISGEYHEKLLEKARRNLEAVQNAFSNNSLKVSFAADLISSLWIRSLVVENRQAGAEAGDLQLDITQESKIDDNTFQIQLHNIVDNSFNIHENENRYLFKPQENADAKLKSYARNDKLYRDGSDVDQLAKELEYVLKGSDSSSSPFNILCLRKNWQINPWDEVTNGYNPSQDKDGRVPIVVVPENGESVFPLLGKWLKTHWPQNRNIVRFLIPKKDQKNIFYDESLIFLARLVTKSQQWKGDDPEFGKLLIKYRTELRNKLKILFDRFAVIEQWNFETPEKCLFTLSSHGVEGDKIPNAIDEIVTRELFVPEDFEELAAELSRNGDSVTKLLAELKEPRPNKLDCIPWIGEERIKDEILKLCAAGKIAINLRGLELLQKDPGETYEEVWNRIKGKLGKGRELDSTNLMIPMSGSGASGSIETPPQGTTEEVDNSDQSKDPGSIFTGSDSNPNFVKLGTEFATSPLNLLGKVESWGVGPATQVKNASISIGNLNGSQLSKLLKNLPDGITYNLSLEKED